MVKGSNLTAMEFLALDQELPNYQKELGAAAVVIKPGVTSYLAKLTNYLEGDRYVSLQRHELKKELYLRKMRDKK